VRGAPILLLLLLVLGCADARPLPSRATRLGLNPTPDLPSPSPQAARPARDFLFPTPLVEVREDGVVTLTATPAGSLDGVRVAWSADGGLLEPAGVSATLRPTDEAWTVTASLIRGSAVLATAVARPGAATSPPRLPVRVGLVPLEPDGCEDLAFPGQVGAGHVGCSEPGRLDRWLPPGGAPIPISPPPSRSSGPPPPLQPAAAASAAGAPRLVVVGDRLVFWGPAEGAEGRPLGRRDRRGRPAASAERYAFARADRVEVGNFTESARVQLPARPSEVDAPVAVAGPWLAVVEGDLGDERLRLLHLDLRAEIAVDGARRPHDPVLSERWLAWSSARGVHALDLRDGRRVDVEVAAGSGPTALLGDDLVVAARGGGLAVVHLATGEVARAGSRLTELRGSAGATFTTWERTPGHIGELVRWELR